MVLVVILLATLKICLVTDNIEGLQGHVDSQSCAGLNVLLLLHCRKAHVFTTLYQKYHNEKTVA